MEELLMKARLSERGFTKECLLNNRGLIGAVMEEFEAYANERGIEELERLIEMRGELTTVGDIVYERDIYSRIEELKKELKRQRREGLLIDVMKKDEEDGLYQND